MKKRALNILPISLFTLSFALLTSCKESKTETEPAPTPEEAHVTETSHEQPTQPPTPQPTLHPGGIAFFSKAEMDKMKLVGADASKATIERLEDENGEVFLRITTDFLPSAPWGVGFHYPFDRSFKKGDVIAAQITARAHKSTTSEAFATLNHEDNGEPYDKSLAGSVSVGPDWKTYYFAYTSLRDYSPNTSQLALHLGFPNQSIDVKDILFVYYGTSAKIEDLPRTEFTYPGREPDAPWRKAAAERIEKFRKADITITVLDPQGNPLPDANVHLKLQKHAFAFGTAVNADVLVNHIGKSADTYRKKIEELFNAATLENHHKLASWVHETNRDTARRAVEWLHNRGLKIRGHTLVWPGWRYNPPDLRSRFENSPELFRTYLKEHISDIMTQTKGKITWWDVLNEPYTNRDFMNVLGDTEMVEWFKHAHATDSAPQLFINDFSILTNAGLNVAHQEGFFKIVEYLLENGAPLQALGEQSHFGWLLTPPDRVYEILNRMALYNLPIHITELDINITDRELQASYMSDYLTIVFSHPAVEGITMWGFWEGAHWAPDAALWDREWNIRPVGKAWLDKVHGEWKTNLNLTTDSTGTISTRGFLGDYLITITHDGSTTSEKATLDKNGLEIKIKLLTPQQQSN